MFFVIQVVLGLFTIQTAATPLPRASSVTLDSAIFTGATSGRVAKFLGIPYAQPPTGDRRFKLPEPIPPYTGTVRATAFGPACPQQSVRLPLPDGLAGDAVDLIVNTAYKAVFPDSEDCLSINVVVPTSATPTSKLPVVVWIFGGGFELGSPSLYDGGLIVERSIQLGEPIIYVSMNYRISAFGFLASREVKDAGVGNLGLQDQREALRWVQKYIGSFGGDPTKVTIWGESAGAISVALHMVANNGNHEGLFRGAFMQSGSPIPVGDISHGQTYYDAIVAETGCSSASDTLACLRSVPYSTLKTATDNTPFIFDYQSLALAWIPRADGVFLTDNPQKLVQAGKVANVPFITGDCDDEGTLFSLSTLNVTTTTQFRTYIKTFFMPQSTNAELDQMLTHYPSDITQGSPFGTGILNALTPQFKRLAAFQGDAVFQAPRRFFLQQRSGKQNTWAFLSKRFKVSPLLGSFHATDILNVYFGGEMGDYLINFVNNLDPNGQGRGINWPKYTTTTPNLVTFNDDLTFPMTITQDTFRKDAINFLTEVTLANPL
ncbi:lipase [Pleurotus eryngii]|uniref:Carboxylic ester hydrolase n=1 Tax=Pleurotus eryngii TaxID=5323 RepID=A0A9P5ZIE7_PLEER|nr:lipase [Pleurotus eryngii]